MNQREGFEKAPWTDDLGWFKRLDDALYADPNTGQKSYKDATVIVDIDPLRGLRLKYSLTVTRSTNGKITTFIEYIDELGTAVRIILPSEVTQRIETLADRLRSENRSRKARESAIERKGQSNGR